MKFLLVGHGGFYNRGCEAIVRTTIMMLRQEFRLPQIILSSFDYKKDRLTDLGKDVKIIPARLDGLWKRWTWPWLLRQLCKVYSKDNSLKVEYLPVTQAIKKADLILSIGGDNFTLDYGSLEYFLELNSLIKRYKKRLIVWAASIGPFPESKKLVSIINNLKLVDLITVRESATVNYLKEINITDNVRKVCDPAFLLIKERVAHECFLPDHISQGILGINISPIIDKYLRSGSDTDIAKEIIIFVENVIKDRKLHVLLVPHVAKNNCLDNDYLFMKKIYDAVKTTKMISIVSPIYNAMQMKYIISKCQFFIGARTHATIAALSSGVPTISIAYSLKSEGINKDIFGNLDYLLRIKELTAESLYNKFRTISERDSDIRKVLHSAIPIMQRQARDNVKYLKELIVK